MVSLEKSFCRPDRTDRADISQYECEAKPALNVGADIELTDFEIEAETICIIANLRHRPLEK